MTRIHHYTVLIALAGLVGCSEPIDPAPTPVGPIVFSVGDERPTATNEEDDVARESNALEAPPAPRNQREGAPWPDPPSATLRAPADPRIEEVDSQTGLPPLPH